MTKRSVADAILAQERLAREAVKIFPRGEIPDIAISTMASSYESVADAQKHLTTTMVLGTLRANQLAEATKKAAESTRDLQEKVYNYGKIFTAVNSAFKLMTAGINEITAAQAKAIAMQRGELSSALQMQMKRTPGAEALRAIPFIGGGMASLAEAVHASHQQALGTEFIARAAEVFEKSIPKMHSAIDQLAVSIASGALSIKYAFAPAEEAYEQKILAIRTSPAGEAAQALQGRRKEVAELVRQRREEAYPSHGQFTPPFGILKERLEEAKKLADQYRTPTILKAEATLRAGLWQLERQAAQQYQINYFRGFQPRAGANYASFGVSTYEPGRVPPVDRVVTEVELTAAIKELTAALQGLNPTGKQGQ